MKYLSTFFKRIILLLVFYTTNRIYFYINNIENFTGVNLLEFIEGVRFDISALFYINIPLLILLLLPHNLRANKYYHKITNWLFYGINIPFLLLNNIDIEYFRFTQKRSTTDFFQLIQLGNDAKNIIPQYLKDYWPITLFSILQIYLLLKIKIIPSEKFAISLKGISQQMLILLFAGGIFIVSARGGLQLKPIKPINAGELCGSQNTSVILNTPFCILHSLDETPLATYNYFHKKKLNNIYSPIHLPKNQEINKQNIVLLIMESYSKEFVGYYNKGESHTPFLDSLMQHGMVFTNAYANGLKSIEALPAITASIPTLMTNPFITSDFAQNKFKSLASLLNDEGYNTSFFHGGQRGTMGFYSFSHKAGFQEYHGMEEYNNNTDFDGTWGIFDGPFMQYFADSLNTKKEPFFSTFFSLSSHPPYVLPEDYKEGLNKIDILETIEYSDYAMRNFFNQIKHKDWFRNTIFIITADHTSGVRYNKEYKNTIGRYAIPLIVFKGDSSLVGENSTVVQQIDIMPTILEEIGYTKPYLAFGKSMFSEENWAISKLYNNYRLITHEGIINNKLENYPAFIDWGLKEEITSTIKDIELLKAIKQDYNFRMKKNHLIYEN
jgi:glucan phosphoethanolaminetransferase (alkaline phosphatase superfamily)